MSPYGAGWPAARVPAAVRTRFRSGPHPMALLPALVLPASAGSSKSSTFASSRRRRQAEVTALADRHQAQDEQISGVRERAVPRILGGASGAFPVMRTRSGRWAVLRASWMNSNAGQAIAVILEEAAPAEVAPMIMAVYGLTDREKMICGLVCQGLSTRRIAGRLHLASDTVQDHLKSVFDMTGVQKPR
jgi:DNA-binding CsgD family transcriptional regulator